MKVVSFDEFCEIPDVVIFSFYDPYDFSIDTLLKRKEVFYLKDDWGVTIGPVDFSFKNLLPERKSIITQVSFPSDLKRWGEIGYGTRFVVYSHDDLNFITKELSLT